MGCCTRPSHEEEACADEGDRPRVVFVLGGPGSGKGTHCTKLCQEFNGILHLSAGDLLRQETESGSKDGAMIEQYMKEGKIIPVQLTARLLLRAIESKKDRHSLFLVDGFPRDAKNLAGWHRIVGSKVTVEFMLFLECDKQVLLERLLKRGKTSGRIDDNKASILKRFDVFESSTKQVVRKFEQDKKLKRVSSVGSKRQVFGRVLDAFSDVLDRMELRRRWPKEAVVAGGGGVAVLICAAAAMLAK